LGRVRHLQETPALLVVNAVERIIPEPITLSTPTSVSKHAITKFHQNYKEKAGWSTQDILIGYKLLENSIKAKVFLALDGRDDEERWLRRQITKYLE